MGERTMVSGTSPGRAVANLIKLGIMLLLLVVVAVGLIDRQASIEQVGTYEAVEKLVNSGESVGIEQVHELIGKEPVDVERQSSRHVMWEHYRWDGVGGRFYTMSVRYQTGATELLVEVQQNSWKGQPFLEEASAGSP